VPRPCYEGDKNNNNNDSNSNSNARTMATTHYEENTDGPSVQDMMKKKEICKVDFSAF
jgi:hypothetical protein